MLAATLHLIPTPPKKEDSYLLVQVDRYPLSARILAQAGGRYLPKGKEAGIQSVSISVTERGLRGTGRVVKVCSFFLLHFCKYGVFILIISVHILFKFCS